MAKSKADLHADAVAAGKVTADTSPDDFSADDLTTLLDADKPAWKGSLSAREPIVAPDGHVVLSQEDIDARDS